MKNEVEILKQSLITQLVVPELMNVERFLLRVLDKAKTLELSENEKLDLGCVYHQAWWFWNKQAKKYFSGDSRLPRFPAFIFPEHKGTAKRSLENLLARDEKLKDRMDVPKVLIKSMANASKFLDRKEAETLVMKKKQSLSDLKIHFDDKAAILHIGDDRLKIKPDTHQYYLLAKMSRLKKDETIDWDDLYEAIKGKMSQAEGKIEAAKDRRSVRDAARGINRRVKAECNTDDLLIEFENKTARRLY